MEGLGDRRDSEGSNTVGERNSYHPWSFRDSSATKVVSFRQKSSFARSRRRPISVEPLQVCAILKVVHNREVRHAMSSGGRLNSSSPQIGDSNYVAQQAEHLRHDGKKMAVVSLNLARRQNLGIFNF
ncbi:hypothetical protein [Candidatus Binatus sp.]|uniref:hypothetical protein n=1 Tax=Candidatus Binatus sp. TaxID=2811406 RepID=UPI003CAFAE3B